MAATLGKNMEVLQYCEAVYSELSDIKKRILDIVCGVEATTTEEETHRGEYLDLFDIVDLIEKKLESLKKRCPPDWKSRREEVERGKRQLVDAVNWWYG